MGEQGTSTARRTPEESRALIVEGARLALADVGLGQITVSEVMERTALGRSSFYVHFRDIEELMLGLLEENVALFAGPSAVWFEDPTPENMVVALRQIVEVWSDNRGWWGELISGAMLPRKQLARDWRATEVDIWSPMIAALIPEDGPAIRSGATAEGVARSFVLFLFSSFADKSMDDEVDVEAVANEVTGIGLALFYGPPS